MIGAPSDDGNGDGSGSVYVFTRVGASWSQQAKLVPSDGAARDAFGRSLDLDGDTIVVGALWADDHGSAYVFERSGSSWSQQAKLVPNDGEATDAFGASVAIQEDRILVGAPSGGARGIDGGSVYVFARSGATWQQVDEIVPIDLREADGFGSAVDLDRGRALVGAPFDDDPGRNTGSAYLFSGSHWTQDAKLRPVDGGAGDQFGWAVALDDGTALVGARLDDDLGGASGSVYVFEGSGTAWDQTAKLLAEDGAPVDVFGSAVALDGETAVVGALLDDDLGEDAGSAYVYERSGTAWEQRSKLTARDGGPDGLFGVGVAVKGQTVLVGASGSDDGAGRAYSFGQDGDQDGLSDRLEADRGTDPLDPDVDADGLLDGEEVHTYGTDPLDPDTDDDLYGDGTEVACGADPTEQTSFPLPTCALPDELAA